MIPDPLVAEIRGYRKQHEKECGNTLPSVIADFKRMERDPAIATPLVSRPPNPLSTRPTPRP